MTQEAHTPEPWEARVLMVKGGKGLLDTITHCGGNLRPIPQRADEAVANARRIVACVNALAGIPIEAIESGVIAELVRCARVISDGSYTSSDLFYLERVLAKLEASK